MVLLKRKLIIAGLIGLGISLGGAARAFPFPSQEGEKSGLIVKTGSGLERLTPTKPPQKLPAAIFMDPSGAPVSLSKFTGKVVVVNFWATWCAPCLKEMPSLNRLQEKYSGKGIEVVAISTDRNGAQVPKNFLARQELKHLKAYHDTKNEMISALRIRGLPTTVILDQAGNEVGRLEGPAEWDSPEVAQTLLNIRPGKGL
jgi:thiol-disulfide isomerase/thioredoxin